MLIAFSVQNFKSIRDLQTLSMEAKTDDHLSWSNVAEQGKHRLVKSAAIYGANASGKSNVVEAMMWFRNFVLQSSKEGQIGEAIDVEPFLLSTATENSPSYFEIEFLWEGFHYQYGVEVDSKSVKAEWLLRKSPSAKPARLFLREDDSFELSSGNFKEGKGLEKRTRPNALFLSVCANFNGEESEKVMSWMQQFRYVSGISEVGFFSFTAERLGNPEHQLGLLNFAQQADFNITAMRSEIEEVADDDWTALLPAETRKKLTGKTLKSANIKTKHSKRNKEGEIVGEVEFDLNQNESQGTKKFVALAGPLTHTLEEGSILIVDELEARLHPKLTQAIVDLFHSPANRRNAQLICSTHDVTLLESDRFRRDQIWFCEKDETGATDLFSLTSFDSNTVRPNSKFSKQYMLGLFGAVPQLSHFQETAADVTK